MTPLVANIVPLIVPMASGANGNVIDWEPGNGLTHVCHLLAGLATLALIVSIIARHTFMSKRGGQRQRGGLGQIALTILSITILANIQVLPGLVNWLYDIIQSINILDLVGAGGKK